ncbi:MAG: O-antigen ligase family protein [Prevotellaceae bacterium]|jgi:O-antigen ligase|nr:O-antigen ligase family protein [Prevotellaceae bacterium]
MKRTVSILLSLLVILLPFGTFTFDGIFRKQEVILCSCCLLSAILLAYLIFLTVNGKRIPVSISILDISVTLFFVYSLMHLLLAKQLQVSEIIVYKWLAVLCIYTLCRIVLHKNMLMYAIVISGFIQSVIAILQKLYIIGNYNIFFDVTGAFNNPGRLGGYVAVAFVASICLLNIAIKNKSYPKFLFLPVASVLLFIALILADSRAAFVGVLCGISVYLYPKIHSLYRRHKFIFTVMLFTSVIFIGLFLFNYRQGSANSRLLIWRVSADMVCDKPLSGHGITSFDRKYMHYQAAYFDKNPDSGFIPVADNVAYAYNEFIHVTVETGIAGLLILLFVFYSAFLSKKQYPQKAVLAALLAFSMFSYPAEVFPLLILFPVIIGCIETKPFVKICLQRGIFIIAGIALLLMIYTNIRSELYFRKASVEFVQIRENNRLTKEYIGKHYWRLKYDHEFCHFYTAWLNENYSENEIFNVLDLLPTSDSYCIFGEKYVKNGMYSKAEECFKIASLMVPNRILPNYSLFKLYQKLGNKEKAVMMANKILNQYVKIINTQTIRMQFEAGNCLQSDSLSNLTN